LGEFCLLGDCLLWAVFWKITENSTNFTVTFFSQKNSFKGLGYIMGAFLLAILPSCIHTNKALQYTTCYVTSNKRDFFASVYVISDHGFCLCMYIITFLLWKLWSFFCIN
jgi:hypothetical protein